MRGSDKYNRPDETIKPQLPLFPPSDIYSLTVCVCLRRGVQEHVTCVCVCVLIESNVLCLQVCLCV